MFVFKKFISVFKYNNKLALNEAIFKSKFKCAIKRTLNKIQTSLILLKTKALKAALTLPTRVLQKLIKKKEVAPINSHPKKKLIKLPAETKISMLITNKFINKIKRSTFGSYRKYEKVYKLTKKAIVKTNII